MSSSVLEIVELENGEIVLRYAGGEPLVNIRFSEEALSYIDNSSLDVAKVMIQAGIQAAAHMDVVADDMVGGGEDTEKVITEADVMAKQTLH